jgi:hypothetical protein
MYWCQDFSLPILFWRPVSRSRELVAAKSQQRRAVRSPSGPERDDGLHAHPDKGDDLKLKNLPRTQLTLNGPVT